MPRRAAPTQPTKKASAPPRAQGAASPGSGPARKASPGSGPRGKAAPGKAPAGKAPAGKATAGKATAGKAPAGKAPAGKGNAAAKPTAAATAAQAANGEAPARRKSETRAAKLRAIREAAARSPVEPVEPTASVEISTTDGVSDESADGDDAARNFGLRGAAPWVARHAAKHAEELRRRNAEPAPPGSARATLRVPPQAEEIKTKIAHLHQQISQVRSLRRRLDTSFFEIGELLALIQAQQLYEAKGYASFEALVDREIDLPRPVAMRLIRIVQTFQRDAAYDYPLESLLTALAALDGELMTAPPSHPSSRGFSSTTLPPKPPIRWE